MYSLIAIKAPSTVFGTYEHSINIYNMNEGSRFAICRRNESNLSATQLDSTEALKEVEKR